MNETGFEGVLKEECGMTEKWLPIKKNREKQKKLRY